MSEKYSCPNPDGEKDKKNNGQFSQVILI